MIALVTGGSRGIGAACVRALKDAGHTVAVAGRTRADCDLFIHADLTDFFGRNPVVSEVIDKLGSIDILVNNAGSQYHQNLIEYSAGRWREQIELMLTVPFFLSQEAARHMLAHGGGHIVNILSTSAFQGARNIAGYVAAKHGLLGLTRAMAIELAPLIRVNAVCPGLTQTSMVDEYITPERRKLLESITPAGRFGKPEEIAGALMYLISSTYVYGQVITVDGGWLSKNG
ncbi:MAG TPA: SDR family oxidoreductase [Anaerolineales bacterium]|nr:SDR family oxidoreductase [Anaerolineales bacterium]